MSTRFQLECSQARPNARSVRNSIAGELAGLTNQRTKGRWRWIGRRGAVIGLALVATGMPLGAQTAITWNFSAGTAAATGSVANISASAISAGNTASSAAMVVNTTSASDFSGASGTYNAGVRTVTAASLSTATSTYFEFTLTPTAGYSLTATALAFGTRSAGTGPTSIALYSSADNYLSSVASTAVSNNSTWSSVSLSGFTVSGLLNGAVTFRLYAAPAGTAGTPNWRIDDVTMTASAIPEPSTYAVAGGVVALLAAALRRRRERSSRRTNAVAPPAV